tara:strand:+ start:904 stop:1722 length:819 start_codon:yes stop_codon:yes gene_type:complete
MPQPQAVNPLSLIGKHMPNVRDRGPLYELEKAGVLRQMMEAGATDRKDMGEKGSTARTAIVNNLPVIPAEVHEGIWEPATRETMGRRRKAVDFGKIAPGVLSLAQSGAEFDKIPEPISAFDLPDYKVKYGELPAVTAAREGNPKTQIGGKVSTTTIVMGENGLLSKVTTEDTAKSTAPGAVDDVLGKANRRLGGDDDANVTRFDTAQKNAVERFGEGNFTIVGLQSDQTGTRWFISLNDKTIPKEKRYIEIDSSGGLIEETLAAPPDAPLAD